MDPMFVVHATSGTVGATATCAANYVVAGTIRRVAVNQCDVPESRTDSEAGCPSDALSAVGTTCSDGNACTAIAT